MCHQYFSAGVRQSCVIVNINQLCRQNIFERGFHGGVVRIFLCKSKYLTFVSSEYFWEKVPRWCRQKIVSSPHSSLDARAELRTEISQQALNRIGFNIIFWSDICIQSTIVSYLIVFDIFHWLDSRTLFVAYLTSNA